MKPLLRVHVSVVLTPGDVMCALLGAEICSVIYAQWLHTVGVQAKSSDGAM